MFNGISTGKTFTGAQYVIWHIIHYPSFSGFIGANTYDQLSQATLRELFYWFDVYGIQYVNDRKPPSSWNAPKLKTYHNVLTVFFNNKATTIFTRVMSNVDALRGIQFSWYWLDETRDTKEYGHDVVLSRMRESHYMRGLITTTTAGEDWAKKRFSDNIEEGKTTYGSMNVPTIEAVKVGIITEEFYSILLGSYSELMAQQELWAKHVNVGTGRAYYAASQMNCRVKAPWGDEYPNPDRELIIGCDFNYAPAPCMWMIGQVGPQIADPKDGVLFSDKIHWFRGLSELMISTPDMTRKLVSQFPGFFYRIFGDASGNRGTNSNAGESDYIQIANTLDELGCVYSIDVDNANPRVKDRVESMNAMLKNGLGLHLMTYNPYTCPDFHSDMNVVGWKNNSKNETQGKLDNAGDLLRTHASDGAGYAIEKLFPLQRRAYIIESNISAIAKEIGQVL